MELQFWQTFWFLVIGAALFIFTWLDGFDLGVGMMLPFYRNLEHRQALLGSIWPLWDGNELWGLIGGGAIFAAFPVVFAGLLSGLYPWIVLLLVFVMLRPTSFEAWHHDEKKRFWEGLFGWGSAVIPLIAGVAIGGTIAGLPFNADHVWDPQRGFWEILSPFSLTTGALFVTLCLVHGAAYLIRKTEGEAAEQARKVYDVGLWVLGALFLVFAILFFAGAGDLVGKPLAGVVIPLALTVIAAGFVLMVLFRNRKRDWGPFVGSSLAIGGTWLFVLGAQFPTLIRSNLDPAYTLRALDPAISSPLNSLSFIGWVGLGSLALVAVYTILIYKVFKGKVNHSTNTY